jgi:hypothetical protein
MYGTAASAPTRRPTEVPYRLPPVARGPQYEDNEVVERLTKPQSQGANSPLKKRREQFVDDDNYRRVSNIERPAQDGTHQRRLSPPKNLYPTNLVNTDNKRRPLRFDKLLLPDEPSHSPLPQSNIDQLANRPVSEKLVVVEQ